MKKLYDSIYIFKVFRSLLAVAYGHSLFSTCHIVAVNFFTVTLFGEILCVLIADAAHRPDAGKVIGGFFSIFAGSGIRRLFHGEQIGFFQGIVNFMAKRLPGRFLQPGSIKSGGHAHKALQSLRILTLDIINIKHLVKTKCFIFMKQLE